MTTEALPPRRPFKFLGGWLCLDFTNTCNWDDPSLEIERFRRYADVLDWHSAAGSLAGAEVAALRQQAEEQPEAAAAALAHCLRLRETIHRIFGAVAAGQPPAAPEVAALNEALAAALAHLQLVRDGAEFGWGWANPAIDLTQAWWPVVRSAGELLTSERLARVGQCGGRSCGWLFFDTTRNHSRRWCEMKHCGNLVKARRHYRRRKTAESSGPGG